MKRHFFERTEIARTACSLLVVRKVWLKIVFVVKRTNVFCFCFVLALRFRFTFCFFVANVASSRKQIPLRKGKLLINKTKLRIDFLKLLIEF